MLIIPSETRRKQTNRLVSRISSSSFRGKISSYMLAGQILEMRIGAISDWIRVAKDYVHSLRATKSHQPACSPPEQLNCPRIHLVLFGRLQIPRTTPCELFNSNTVLEIKTDLGPCLIDHRYQFIGGVDNTFICWLGFGNVAFQLSHLLFCGCRIACIQFHPQY